MGKLKNIMVKIGATLLSAGLLLGNVPVTAFAAETPVDLTEKVKLEESGNLLSGLTITGV